MNQDTTPTPPEKPAPAKRSSRPSQTPVELIVNALNASPEFLAILGRPDQEPGGTESRKVLLTILEAIQPGAQILTAVSLQGEPVGFIARLPQ